jgi:hypothetical protein
LILQLDMVFLDQLLNICHRIFPEIKFSILCSAVIASLFIVFFEFLQFLLLS